MFVILNTFGAQEVLKGFSKADTTEKISTSFIMKDGVDAMMSTSQLTLIE